MIMYVTANPLYRSSTPPGRGHPMRRTSNRRAAGEGTSGGWAGLRLLLQIGSDTIEVQIAEDGIRFRHPETQTPEGVVGWEEALALSMLPDRARRCGARPAA